MPQKPNLKTKGKKERPKGVQAAVGVSWSCHAWDNFWKPEILNFESREFPLWTYDLRLPKKPTSKSSYLEGKLKENHVLKTPNHQKCLFNKELITPYLSVTEKGKSYCQLIIRKLEAQGVCSKSHRLPAVDMRQEMGPFSIRPPPGIWGPHKIEESRYQKLNTLLQIFSGKRISN